jgi:hypothetical protein
VRHAAISDIKEWPTSDELDVLYPYRGNAVALIPRLIASKIPLPDCFEHLLAPWQQDFYQFLVHQEGPHTSLSQVFFSLLTDFLQRLQSPPSTFSPTAYRELLYVDTTLSENESSGPLGLVDPMGVIQRLLESLEIVWEQRQAFSLGDLRQFRFSGLGLLQGRSSSNPAWITIVAYCGGWLYKSLPTHTHTSWSGTAPDKLTKCGYTPLVIGKHHTCAHCGKLICPKCHYCSDDCEKAGIRGKRMAAAIDAADKMDSDVGIESSPPQPFDEEIPIEFYSEWAEELRSMKN